MDVHITWQTVITASAFIGAVAALIGFFTKGVRWFDRQKKQDADIIALREKHNSDMHESREERQLLVYGILACLKGLKEQGCNGPVTEAIDKIEKHLNKKAHE